MTSVACVLLALGLGVAGCSSREPSPPPDGGAGDSVTPARRTLRPLGPANIALAPRAETTLRVRLLDESEAGVPDEVVSFALVGETRGSTVRALDASTDANGTAAVVLVAGPVPTAFRVRVSAPGASPFAFDVAVGTELGELEVGVGRPSHLASARPITELALRVFADARCAELPAAPAHERRVSLDVLVARFSALPTTSSWTVDVRGLAASGQTLARGCVEGVRLRASEVTRIHVEIAALPLVASGVYAAELTLLAGWLGAEVRRKLVEELPSDRGAALLLDGVQREFEARGYLIDATSLLASRAAGLDLRVEDELTRRGLSVYEIVAALADEVEADFDALEFEMRLRIGGSSEAPRARIGASTIHGPFGFDAAAVEVDESRDVLRLRSASLRVGPAWLFAAGLHARANARHADGLAGSLRDGDACSVVVSQLVRERILVSCDADCVRAGCARAAGDLETRLAEAGARIDGPEAKVRFDVATRLLDFDADLRADGAEAVSVRAEWETASALITSALDGQFSAVRDDGLP